MRDPRSGIRDGEKSGSGINIPDLQHCFLYSAGRSDFDAGKSISRAIRRDGP